MTTYRTHLFKKLYMIGDIDGILEEIQVEVGGRLVSMMKSNGLDPKTMHLTVSAQIMGRIDGTKEVLNVDTGMKEGTTGLDVVRFNLEVENVPDDKIKLVEQAIANRLPGR